MPLHSLDKDLQSVAYAAPVALSTHRICSTGTPNTWARRAAL